MGAETETLRRHCGGPRHFSQSHPLVTVVASRVTRITQGLTLITRPDTYRYDVKRRQEMSTG